MVWHEMWNQRIRYELSIFVFTSRFKMTVFFAGLLRSCGRRTTELLVILVRIYSEMWIQKFLRISKVIPHKRTFLEHLSLDFRYKDYVF